MAAFNPPSIGGDPDYKKLYNYVRLLNDQLLYSFKNIDPQDNFGLEALVKYEETETQLKVLEITTNGLVSQVVDFEQQIGTQIKILNGEISLKVSSGDLVSEINATTESINFKTGTLIIESNNFSLDREGNAQFSGNIIGGSININNQFIVTENGAVESDIITVAKEVHVEGLLRTNYMSIGGDVDVEGNMTCVEMRVYGPLYCHEYYFPSDRRLKENIKEINDNLAHEIVMRMKPVTFDFISTKEKSMGLIAQDVQEIVKELNIDLPLVYESEEYLGIPYHTNSVLLAGAIKTQQKQIEELERKLEECKNNR